VEGEEKIEGKGELKMEK
jgi:hypothetical protein